MSGYKSFAHLLGLGRGKAAKASGDDPITEDYNTPDPADEQYAEDDEDDAKARKARKARRAENDDDEAGAEDDKPDADDEDEDDAKARKARKARKATRAEDDDDEADAEDDDDGKSAKAIRRSAVKAERERGARIIAHGIKCGNVEQAAALAFDSNMTPSAAAAVLGLAKGAAAPGKTNLASRMDRVQTPNAGMGDADQSGGMSPMAAAIIAAAADAHQ